MRKLGRSCLAHKRSLRNKALRFELTQIATELPQEGEPILSGAGMEVLCRRQIALDHLAGRPETLKTYSGKYALYSPSILDVEITYGSLEDCVASAVERRVVQQPLSFSEDCINNREPWRVSTKERIFKILGFYSLIREVIFFQTLNWEVGKKQPTHQAQRPPGGSIP